MKKLNIVYFATPDFSVPSLEILHQHPLVNIQYIISMPDKKAGRGMALKSPEVIEYAKKHKLSYFQTNNINQEEEFIQKLKSIKPDLFIVLAFAQFLSQKILDIPKYGPFNIHTSLLPKYRGAAPIQHALLNGDEITGVSIQKMVKKMDAGDIVASKEINIQDEETGGQLYTRLKFQAALELNNFINLVQENALTFKKQNEENISFAPTLKREDGYLCFKSETYEQIKNKVRAFFPWPGTFCFLNEKRLKVFHVSPSSEKLSPGEVETKNRQLIVGCLDGAIRIESLQLEGKKPCSDIELLNGLQAPPKINPQENL